MLRSEIDLAFKSSARPPCRHVVMYSGGIGSYCAARRVIQRRGITETLLLFTDTLGEDSDLYRFLVETALQISGLSRPDLVIRAASLPPAREEKSRLEAITVLRIEVCSCIPRLIWLAEGRTIWDVFRDERFLGNSRTDPCSKILKREMADKWLRENCRPESTRVYVGIDWSEEHRFTGLRDRRYPWIYEAPMCSAPYLTKNQMFEELATDGIARPGLYDLGFSHNNCSGGCVKAGIGHFTNLYHKLPDVFDEWERREEEMRQFLGRTDISILRDRRIGADKTLTLAQLRHRIMAGEEIDRFDIGGCGCFADS